MIDPEMSEELRETVVGTGLGADKAPRLSLVTEVETAEVVIDNTPADVDYDLPTVLRKEKTEQQQVVNGDVNMDYLDIPAFLRRQAD